MRAFGIWASGLLASAIVGGLIGDRLEPGYSGGGGFWGFIAGMMAFTCIRLWLTPKT